MSNDFFTENKAEQTLKETMANEKISNEMDSAQVKELKGMSRLLEKLQIAATKENGLSAASAKGNFELVKVLKEIQDKEAQGEADPESNLSFSDTGQASLDLMKDIAKSSLDADQAEQKILKDELSNIQDFIKGSVVNPEESQALFEINKSIQNGVDANSTLLAKFSDGIMDGLSNKLMPALVGTIATVFSDSPIFGIMAGLIGEGTRKAFEARKQKVADRRERARFRLEKLSEAHTKRLVELQELAKSEAAEEQNDEMAQEEQTVRDQVINIDQLAEMIGEQFAFEFEDLVDVISDGLRAKFKEANIDLDQLQNLTTDPVITPNEELDPLQNSAQNPIIVPIDNSESNDQAKKVIERDTPVEESPLLQKEDSGPDALQKDEGILGALEAIRSEIETGNSFQKRGVEERRRESKIERAELVSAIEGMKGSGIDGNSEEEMGGLMDKLDMLGIGGIFTSIGLMFGKLARGAKSLFGIAKKVFLPITAAISAFSGVSTALDKFAESGSILEALGAGLQETGSSIIKMFTFGLLDAEKIGGFLRDTIPTSISDPVFRAVDWIADLFSDPLGSLKSMGSSLMETITNAVMSPIIAIQEFFNRDFTSDFASITDFLGSMSETVYEWIASIIPDFIPNALIPDSILKYKDSQAAAEVATDEFNELSQQVGESTLITPQMLNELQHAQQKMQEANIKAIKDQITNSEEPIARDDPRFEQIKKFEEGLVRTKENLGHSQRRIDQIENPVATNSPLLEKVDKAPANNASRLLDLQNENKANPAFVMKTAKINLAEQIETLKRKIEQSMKEKETQNQQSTNVSSNQSIVNNNASTHINKQVFNSDPSIMRPVLN
ncbi:MAG: hypothetical protein QM489_00345 [Candidatus Izemoplasma sp.]